MSGLQAGFVQLVSANPYVLLEAAARVLSNFMIILPAPAVPSPCFCPSLHAGWRRPTGQRQPLHASIIASAGMPVAVLLLIILQPCHFSALSPWFCTPQHAGWVCPAGHCQPL
jgi:hypothetical protein